MRRRWPYTSAVAREATGSISTVAHQLEKAPHQLVATLQGRQRPQELADDHRREQRPAGHHPDAGYYQQARRRVRQRDGREGGEGDYRYHRSRQEQVPQHPEHGDGLGTAASLRCGALRVRDVQVEGERLDQEHQGRLEKGPAVRDQVRGLGQRPQKQGRYDRRQGVTYYDRQGFSPHSRCTDRFVYLCPLGSLSVISFQPMTVDCLRLYFGQRSAVGA